MYNIKWIWTSEWPAKRRSYFPCPKSLNPTKATDHPGSRTGSYSPGLRKSPCSDRVHQHTRLCQAHSSSLRNLQRIGPEGFWGSKCTNWKAIITIIPPRRHGHSSKSQTLRNTENFKKVFGSPDRSIIVSAAAEFYIHIVESLLLFIVYY